MNISSYNISDVSYHYIGLRVLAGLPPTARREEQISSISRNVLRYVSDRSLRLMLPEPKGTFETVGEKICQELVHFQFARLVRGAYEITDAGHHALELLNGSRHVELRRLMASVHLRTYDNLRVIVQKHLEVGSIWRPIVESSQYASLDYVQRLLEPTFDGDAPSVAAVVLSGLQVKNPKKVEDALHERILRRVLPEMRIGVPLFRAICDRLVSLRLLNIMKASIQESEFAKSYSPCVAGAPPHDWYTPLKIEPPSGETFVLYFCEPDMSDEDTQRSFLQTLDAAFSELSSQAGYYDLPEVRDFVCERLRIPEAAFDEGVNYLLDRQSSPLTVGLHYEGISSRRKPLTRNRAPVQIYNLIRRV